MHVLQFPDCEQTACTQDVWARTKDAAADPHRTEFSPPAVADHRIALELGGTPLSCSTAASLADVDAEVPEALVQRDATDVDAVENHDGVVVGEVETGASVGDQLVADDVHALGAGNTTEEPSLGALADRPGLPQLTADDVSGMTVAQLKEELRNRGCSTSGKKADLQQRLSAWTPSAGVAGNYKDKNARAGKRKYDAQNYLDKLCWLSGDELPATAEDRTVFNGEIEKLRKFISALKQSGKRTADLAALEPAFAAFLEKRARLKAGSGAAVNALDEPMGVAQASGCVCDSFDVELKKATDSISRGLMSLYSALPSLRDHHDELRDAGLEIGRVAQSLAASSADPQPG